MKRLRLATRGSELALAQARQTRSLLGDSQPDLEVEIVIIRTHGDVSRESLSTMSGVGVFVKEIEDSLLRGDTDMAVHSLKDLPTVDTEGLTIVALLEREDPRDALIARAAAGLDDLPIGARVATASPRRRAQLLAVRPDLELVSVRGNVDTRIAKLRSGQFDAIVLALAGLRRLGRADEVTEILESDVMLPAPGQGAIALQARRGSAAAEIAARLDHAPTRAAVEAERSMLLALGGGCSVPVAALASAEGDQLELTGLVADPRAAGRVRASAAGPIGTAHEIGRSVANALELAGARAILDGLPGARPLAGRRILNTRPREQAAELSDRLRELGAELVALPAIEIAPPKDRARLAAAVAEVEAYGAVAFTSVTAVRRFTAVLTAAGGSPSALTVTIGAVGPATAEALRGAGYRVEVEAEKTTGAGLAEALAGRISDRGRVLVARADGGRPELTDDLRSAGFAVDDVATHCTVPADGLAVSLAALAPCDWVVYASPSAVRSVAGAASDRLATARVACIGPTTATAARDLGIGVDVCPERATTDELVGGIVRATLEQSGEG